ncbi:DUF1932 domain-containing protein [Georgenia deserti]|uniref:DUF1932 domain-containing protein n=1 Tax=Georgenia deserti TaxID=2093781 RepID=A0ABW4L1T6_9MICO
MHVALLGLGEAGRIYARDLLARGVVVSGYDPRPDAAAAAPDGLRLAASDAAAARDADLVLSLVGAASAEAALGSVLADITGVFADLNTTSPAHKATLARSADAAGVHFADVAVLAPLPRDGIGTPLLVSGTGAEAAAALLDRVGAPIEQAGPQAGTAAGLKLLRSVFMKGLAGLVFEGLTAAERTGRPGAVAWLRGQIAAELGPDGDALVARLIAGTRTHAARRAAEADDVARYLGELGSPVWMTEGTRRWLQEIAAHPELADSLLTDRADHGTVDHPAP